MPDADRGGLVLGGDLRNCGGEEPTNETKGYKLSAFIESFT
jgi:hypothetical protein